jgi:hypothetical protein
MNRVSTVLRATGAALLSAVIAVAAFVLFGLLLPIWAMVLLYGRQGVQDSPAHGGIILFLTLPIAGVLSLCGFLHSHARCLPQMVSQ